MCEALRINSSSSTYLVGFSESPLQLFCGVRGVVFFGLEAHQLRLKLLLLPAELALLVCQGRPLLLRLYHTVVGEIGMLKR